MKKYKCKICGLIISEEEYNKIEKCPKCGAGKDQFEVIEETFPITGPIPISEDNPGLARIVEKCIKCGRCSEICQGLVGIHYDPNKALNPVCLSCGQCILNCPVGALVTKFDYKKVFDYIKDTHKVLVAFTSPAVRVSLGEEFGLSGVNVEGQMVAALKQLGFDYVFDTTFGADLTIMEEASELLERLNSGTNLPQFTSCCPAWVRYVEIYHPKLIPNLSTCKSPIGMQGSIIKSYFAEMMELPKERIVSVAITPCTAKKYEITEPHNTDTDFVMTATELAMLMREQELDLNKLEPIPYDEIMSRGSGGGVLFGASGGVMESALRVAYNMATGERPPKKLLAFQDVRGYDNVKEATVEINGKKLNLLTVNGLRNIEPLLQDLENGLSKYQFIEVMNCPGGCVGGGGQPLSVISQKEAIIKKRMEGLYSEDSLLAVKLANENPDIIDLYRSYLTKPLSPKALELLHTVHTDKSSILGE